MQRVQALAIVLVAAVLSGCGASQSSPPAGSTVLAPASAMRALDSSDVADVACPKSRIYVADYGRSDVEIYAQGVTNPTPCGKITTGISYPEGIYVNGKGMLFVANYIGSTITEYPRGKKAPTITISTAAPAYDVFVGSNGILYAAEPATDSVAEYPAGSTTPSLTVTVNGGAYGVATDKKNNLYVSYLSNADGLSHVEKFAPGATTGTDMGFTVPFAGELKLTKQNDIVIGDRDDDLIDIFPPGATKPSRSFSTPGGRPVNLALNRAETVLYVVGLGQVQVMDYQTGVTTSTITSQLESPSGVAPFPPAPY
jgi:hypothetical protein